MGMLKDNVDFIIHRGSWSSVWLFEPVSQDAKHFVEAYLAPQGLKWICNDYFYFPKEEAKDLVNYLFDKDYQILSQAHDPYKSGSIK